MKKAEDYLTKEAISNLKLFDLRYVVIQNYNDKLKISLMDTIIKTIKQAQIDAIEETVKRCSENAQIDFVDLTSDKIFDYSECLLDDNVDVIINKESIFGIAEQLKKELE